MDFGHLHLALNHVPVIGVVFAFFILLGGLFARSKAVTVVGLGMVAVAAIVAVPVYLTGESAEEIVEKLPGVTESVVGQHESAAGLSFGLIIASGLFALAALAFSRSRSRAVPGYLVIATLLMSLLTGTSMVRTANLGGQIRHTEIRSGVQNTDAGGDPGTLEKRAAEEDDDD